MMQLFFLLLFFAGGPARLNFILMMWIPGRQNSEQNSILFIPSLINPQGL